MATKQQAPANPEHRWPVLIAVSLSMLVYFLLPPTITFLPSWVIPSISLVVIAPLILFNPRRLSRESTWSRGIGIGFAIGLAIINQVYIIKIIVALVDGQIDGPSILLTALGVWITNVSAFALLYWEIDKGGPVARRVEGLRDTSPQHFRFPQQDNPKGVEGWMPEFFDYAYFSLSNMMAFSPTDVMPLTQRAKMLMAYQALTGFVILALVISRAVNILT